MLATQQQGRGVKELKLSFAQEGTSVTESKQVFTHPVTDKENGKKRFCFHQVIFVHPAEICRVFFKGTNGIVGQQYTSNYLKP